MNALDYSYSAVAPLLVVQGYEPMPALKRTKYPCVKYRQGDYNFDSISVQSHMKRFPDGNTCVRMKGSMLAIDSDVESEAFNILFKQMLTEEFGLSPIRGRPGSSRCLVPFRCEEALKPGVVKFGNHGNVDVVTGQIAAYGQHTSGQYYEWQNGELFDTAIEELPLITHTQLASLMERLTKAAKAELNIEQTDSTVAKMIKIVNEEGRVVDGYPTCIADPTEVEEVCSFLLIEKGMARGGRDDWLKIIQGAHSTAWPGDDCYDWLIEASRCEEYPEPDDEVIRQWNHCHSYDGNGITYASVKQMALELGYTQWRSSKQAQIHIKSIAEAESTDELERDVMPAIVSDYDLSDIGREEVLGSLHTRLKLFEVAIDKRNLRKQIACQVTASTGLPPWGKGIVSIDASNRYIHLATGRIWDEQALNTSFRNKPEVQASGKQASTLLSSDSDFKSYSDTVYAPGQPLEIDRNGVPLLNTYSESAAMLKARAILEGDAELAEGGHELIRLYKHHLEILFPDKSERNIIEEYIAYRAQNPSVRINYAVVIQGPMGIGKSTLGTVLRNVFGSSNCGTISADNLKSSFTDWAEGKILAVVDEIRITGGGRYDVLERMKSSIADDFLSLNIKFRDKKEIQNHTNYMMFTNHIDAIPIDDSDRRYAVLCTHPRTQEDVYNAFGGKTAHSEHFKRLNELIEKHPEALALYWLERDLCNFNPKAHAPMTEAKRQMALAARPDDEVLLDEVMDEHSGPAIGDDVIDVTLLKELVGYEDHLPNDTRLAQILKGRGYCKQEQRLIINSQKHRVWCVGKYSNQELRKRIEKHKNDITQRQRLIAKGIVADIAEYREARQQLHDGLIEDIEEYCI